MAIRLGALTLASVISCIDLAVCQVDLTRATPVVSSDSPERPTSNYREGLIHLDVGIADQAGNPIPALEMPDLTLLDNGKPARILTLRPAYPSDINARLTEVALVIDELNTSGMVLAQARSDLINFLRRNHGTLAQPTSIYRLTSTGFYGSAWPTTDGNQLARDVARNSFPRPIWRLPTLVLRNQNNWSKAVRSVYALAVKWREDPGRKALIWIGPGWPADGYLPESEQTFPHLVELLSRIREARMVMYQASLRPEIRNPDADRALYASGAHSDSEMKRGRPATYFSLPALALDSGGMILDEGFSYAEEFVKCVRDAGMFYIVSFDPPRAAGVDEYHDLKVSVTKPGAIARTHTGYYDQPVFYDQLRTRVRRVTVRQLESMLGRADQEHDSELAAQLNGVVLTERLSSSKLASWFRKMPGKQSREALTVLADASVFLNPPPDEIPAKPAPDHRVQVEMLNRVVQYINQSLPRLPDFYAIRTLVQYGQRLTATFPWKTAPADQSLHEWATEKATLLYRKGREEQIVHKRKENKSLRRDLSFIGTFGPILHQIYSDATSDGHGFVWGGWQRGEQGDEAVFRYSVGSEHPQYEIIHCCLRNHDTLRIHPSYHGELAIDPQSGAILRLTMQSEPGWIVEPNLTPVEVVRATGTMVEYGSVRIAGRTFICPLRSVITTRARDVKTLILWEQESSMYAPYEDMMDDYAFSDYHKFGSESRILPDFDLVQDSNPSPGKSAPPAGQPAHH